MTTTTANATPGTRTTRAKPTQAPAPRSATASATSTVTDRAALVALEAEICAIASSMSISRARLSALVGEFDAAGGWIANGATSCAHWLAELLDIELCTAREQVRVARALRDLPMTRQEFAQGRLSYAKVRQLTRVATPDNETDLLAIAHTCAAGELARRLADHQQRHDPEGAQARRRDERGVSFRDEPNGNRTVIAQLDLEHAALLEALIDTELGHSDAPVDAPADAPTRESLRHQRADALARLIDRMIDQLATGTTTTTTDRTTATTSARTSPDAPAGASQTSGPRVELVLHRRIGQTTLADGAVLPEAIARQLSCDADLRVMTHWPDGSPADVGRRHRLITPRLRRLVTERDHGRCQYPGCPTRHFLHHHHLVHWEDGGPTTLANLTTLCGHHHRHIHDHGWPPGTNPLDASNQTACTTTNGPAPCAA